MQPLGPSFFDHFFPALKTAIFNTVEPSIHRHLAHSLFSAYSQQLQERCELCVDFFVKFIQAAGFTLPQRLERFTSPDQAARMTWGDFKALYGAQFVKAVAIDHAAAAPWTIPGNSPFLPF